MKQNLIFIIILLVSLMIFFSCSEEEPDVQKPVIELLSPVDDQVVARGEDFVFEAVLNDDNGLNQMKIDIHPAEGHDHKSMPALVPWQWDTIIDLTGRSVEKKFMIPVPANIEVSPYHFIVFLTDQSGNEISAAIIIDVEE